MECLKTFPDICKQGRKKNFFGSAYMYPLTDWVLYNTLLAARYRLMTVSCWSHYRGV
jgi:hypothetical protein